MIGSLQMTTPTPDSASRETDRLVRVLAHHKIDFMLDIGANEGQFGDRLRLGGFAGKICSVEPIPALCEALARRVKADGGWTVAPAQALGAEAGEATLTVAEASDLSSLAPVSRKAQGMLSDTKAVEQITVPVSTLDQRVPDWVPAGARPALKIDTQGTELDVLRGGKAAIDQFIVLVLELSLVPLYDGEPEWRTVMDAVAVLGFEPVLFLPGYFNKATARQVGMDGVFVRRDCLDMRLG